MFFDRKPLPEHTLTGQWREYNLATKQYENPRDFKYGEIDTANKEIEEFRADADAESTDTVLETVSPFNFKTKDLVKDQFGNDYKIISVGAIPLENFYKARKRNSDLNKIKTLVCE